MLNSQIEEQLLNMCIIAKYEELDKNKRFLMKAQGDHDNYNFVNQFIRNELLKICDDPYHVTDVLVYYLYEVKKSKHKATLWDSFGDIINENLKRNLAGTSLCEDCGVRFTVTKQRQVRCEECQEIRTKEKAMLRKQKFNNKKKK